MILSPLPAKTGASFDLSATPFRLVTLVDVPGQRPLRATFTFE